MWRCQATSTGGLGGVGPLGSIDRNQPIPAYYQLKEILRSAIASGRLKPEDKIPEESLLGSTYGVSRMTARRAIQELQKEGLVYRRRALGTFVARPKFERELGYLSSFTQDLRKQGFTVNTRILGARQEGANDIVAGKLDVAQGSPVYVLERVKVLNGVSMYLETAWLPAALCPGLIEIDLVDASLHEVLETSYGVKLASASIGIEACSAGNECVQHLGVKRGTPLLHFEQVTYLDSGQPVIYQDGFVRGNGYKYRVFRTRG
ncbi:MAG: GntR family transcriptional regulator [Bacillota bacterium]|nr:GntR family transcriptional regulator [Bacillota bacterium]